MQYCLSIQEVKGGRNVKQFCIWTWHMVLCSSWCWVEEKRISRLVDRQPWQRRGGSVWDCCQSSSNHLSTTHSGKTEPAITNNIFIWDTFSQRSKLTAALDTTVFWSHSIRTSKKVALFLSIACRTFPKKSRNYVDVIFLKVLKTFWLNTLIFIQVQVTLNYEKITLNVQVAKITIYLWHW